MKQTAVEWLWSQLPSDIYKHFLEEFNQAKAIENEQIKNEREEAYNNGYANGQKDAYTN